MKTRTLINLITSFYWRMKAQNVVSVVLFIIAITTLNIALTFYLTTNNAANVLTKTYFEYKSIDVSQVQKVLSNNDLITMNQYKRPDYQTLANIRNKIGDYSIKPDYTMFFMNSTFTMFEEEIAMPQIVVHNNSNQIGINETFYRELAERFALTDETHHLNWVLNAPLYINEEIQYNITFVHSLTISFVFAEINYFSFPKIYIPQQIIDEVLGRYLLTENVTVASLLYNLPNDHTLTNRKYRLHFTNEQTYKTFLRISESYSAENSTYEISGDYYEKGMLFESLFVYLRLLVLIFLILVLIGVTLILFVVINSFIDKNKTQIALFELFHEKCTIASTTFSLINFVNFGFSFFSYPLTRVLIEILNKVVSNALGISTFLKFNNSLFLCIYLLLGMLSFFLLKIIAFIKLRKPLLTTLIAYD